MNIICKKIPSNTIIIAANWNHPKKNHKCRIGGQFLSKYLACKVRKKVVMKIIYTVEDISMFMCLKKNIDK